MSTSYRTGAGGVNASPRKPSSSPASTPVPAASSAPSPRERERHTATFAPYYWEAYNEVVQPRRFDWYLIRRWGPSLGPTGFMIVKVLRDRCYHNPTTGDLRDTCEIDLDELGAAIGVSRATVVRELQKNAALGHFVRRVRQFRMVNGRPQKDRNAYQVSMDDPIHPDDMEAYDDLRAIREAERFASSNGTPKTVIKGEDGRVSYKAQNEPNRQKPEKEAPPYTAQNEPYSDSYTAQNEPLDTKYLSAQNEQSGTTYLSNQNEPTISDSLLSGLTEESLTPSQTPAGTDPPINSPQGDEEGNAETAPLPRAWASIQPELRDQLTAPAYGCHIATLRPLDLIETPDAATEAVIGCPSAFTREWIEKRHALTIAEALGRALGRAVTVRLVQMQKGGC